MFSFTPLSFEGSVIRYGVLLKVNHPNYLFIYLFIYLYIYFLQ